MHALIKKILFTISCSMLLLSPFPSVAKSAYKIARLKYNGGGDWYCSRTALRNLSEFCNMQLNTDFGKEEDIIEVGSPSIFNYPYTFLSGHGNVVFSDEDIKNIRAYLLGGGFLHIDDNYGLDKFIRPQMKKVFPNKEFIELPPSHDIFNQKFIFPNGLPKIHEHDGKRAQAFALFNEGRIICLYTYESDLGNGWEDIGTYPDDSKELHITALKMGANIIQYVFTQ